MVSLDALFNLYTTDAAASLSESYPGRHRLVAGLSQDLLAPGSSASIPAAADLILIDGDHRFEGALADLVQGCARFAGHAHVPGSDKAGALVVMDDVGEGCHNRPVSPQSDYN